MINVKRLPTDVRFISFFHKLKNYFLPLNMITISTVLSSGGFVIINFYIKNVELLSEQS